MSKKWLIDEETGERYTQTPGGFRLYEFPSYERLWKNFQFALACEQERRERFGEDTH